MSELSVSVNSQKVPAKPLNILLVHNYYQHRGGEDVVVERERDLLLKNGVNVFEYFIHNDQIDSFWAKIKTALSTHFSKSHYKAIRQYLEAKAIDIVHVHNTFPLITPSVFYACKDAGIPVVMTLHNYRIVCPTAVLMHQGKICERSFNERAYWALKHKVYHNSWLGTLVLCHLVEFHKKRGTWQNKVDHFFCLSDFARQQYCDWGISAEKITIKPNFMPEVVGLPPALPKTHALYVGRLSPEKGIEVLIEAWSKLDIPLKIAGSGELSERSKLLVEQSKYIELLGFQDKASIEALLDKSFFVVVPSICYEGSPLAIYEAYARGIPLLASRLGSLIELVDDQVTGMTFEAGNSDDLAEKATKMLSNEEALASMGLAAFEKFNRSYTDKVSFTLLIDQYQKLIQKNADKKYIKQ